MSYYSQEESRSAAARVANRQDSNRRFIAAIIIIIVIILLGIMIYLYLKVLAGVKIPVAGSSSNTTGTTTVTSCSTDSQCPISNPKCDQASKTCVSCLSNSDCTGNVTVCDTSKHVCVQCIDNSTCVPPERCNLAIGQCIECSANADCGSGGICASGICACNVVAPSSLVVTFALTGGRSGNGCSDVLVQGSWTAVRGAISYDLQISGPDANNNRTSSARALGIPANGISGSIYSIFNDAPQGNPASWCTSVYNVQVRSNVSCGSAGTITSEYSPLTRINNNLLLCCPQ